MVGLCQFWKIKMWFNPIMAYNMISSKKITCVSLLFLNWLVEENSLRLHLG
jgi:hypothetical protein